MRWALILGLLGSCGGPAKPRLPYVHLVVAGEPLKAYLDGARAWSELGFTVGLEDQGKPECPSTWRREPLATSCQFSIALRREPGLRLRTGTNALAWRPFREIVIDTDVVNYYDLIISVAHEVGHVLLDTSAHTKTGVMSGAVWALEPEDRALACVQVPKTCVR